MGAECQGTHRYFVAETGTVEAEGKVCIIIVCTSCGESKLINHMVAGVTLNPKKEK
jgi:hypothetical protein